MRTNPIFVAIVVLGLPLSAAAQAPAVQSPSSGAQAPSPNEQPPAARAGAPLPENAPTVNLLTLIDRLAEEMDKEFILDPQIARVTGLSTARADADYDTLLAILRQSQYAAIEHGDQIRLVPDATARFEPSPMVNEDDSRISDHAVVTRVIDVSDIEVRQPAATSDGQPTGVGAQLIPVLRPLMSTNIGNISTVSGSNKIILTDRYDNIRRITAIIDALR